MVSAIQDLAVAVQYIASGMVFWFLSNFLRDIVRILHLIPIQDPPILHTSQYIPQETPTEPIDLG